METTAPSGSWFPCWAPREVSWKICNNHVVLLYNLPAFTSDTIVVMSHECHIIWKHLSEFAYLFNGLFGWNQRKHHSSTYLPFVREPISDWWIRLAKVSNGYRPYMTWCHHDLWPTTNRNLNLYQCTYLWYRVMTTKMVQAPGTI